MRESRLWLLSLAAALLVLALLAAHFAVMHYSPAVTGMSIEDVRSMDELIARGRDSVQMVLYILFLAVALYHGLYGLRGVLLEMPFAAGRQRSISLLLLLIGLVFFAYGTYVTWWTFAIAS